MNRNLTPVRWANVKVGDIATVVSGKRPPVVKDTQVPSANVPVYGGAGRTGYTEQPLFSEPILITGRVGALGLLHKVTIPSWPSDNTLVIKPDRSAVHFEYLFYCLVKRIRELASFNRGTSNPLIVQGDVKSLEVMMPPLPEQRAIAHILGTLDDKIELNHRMNQTLEAMAQALFKSWFVDFEPFRDQGMQDSPLGEIPAGWRVGKLEEVAVLHKESISPTDYPDEIFNHYSIPAFDESRTPKAETGREIKSNKFQIPTGAVLISKLNPRFPRVWLPFDNERRWSICSTEFLVVTPKRGSGREYLFSLFRSDGFLTTFSTLVTGTSSSHQRVRPDDLLSLDVIVPTEDAVSRYCDKIRPLFALISHNLIESDTLADIRDALLPKLLSGEIRVKDAEKFVEEANSLTQKQAEAIYTIGHSNHSLEDFIGLLRKHNITAVADVRSSPVSKHNPQFNMDVLSTALRKEKIAYVFMGRELGGRPDDPNCYDNSKANYLKMGEKPTFSEGVNRLLKGRDQHRIVLLCAEKEPLQCHRTILIARKLQRMGIPVKHILANGEIEDHHDAEQRMVRSLGIGKGLFDYTLSETERIEKAYNEQARKMAYTLHQQWDDNEPSE